MKKLVLKKDVVTNLNDTHMNQLRGGTGVPCSIIAFTSAAYEITNGFTAWGQTCGNTCEGTWAGDNTCPGYLTCNGANTCQENATCPGTQCPAYVSSTCVTSPYIMYLIFRRL